MAVTFESLKIGRFWGKIFVHLLIQLYFQFVPIGKISLILYVYTNAKLYLNTFNSFKEIQKKDDQNHLKKGMTKALLDLSKR